MPSLGESVEACYGTRDLYSVLGVEKSASPAQLRKAYHQASLKTHPDKVPADQVDQATEKFQVITVSFKSYIIPNIPTGTGKGLLSLVRQRPTITVRSNGHH